MGSGQWVRDDKLVHAAWGFVAEYVIILGHFKTYQCDTGKRKEKNIKKKKLRVICAHCMDKTRTLSGSE